MGGLVVFYAVTGGRCSGIFTSRKRALNATVGYPDAKFDVFSTRLEAEAFMNEEEERVKCSSNGAAAAGWSGPAYAVAVGRRMGVFRSSGEALGQTLRYSGNSMKKFPTYAEAVEFLDRHNWRKMPGTIEVAARTKPQVCVDASSSDEGTTPEQGNPQDPESPVVSPKRGRDEDQPEAPRATQRRRVSYDDMQPPGKTVLMAFCCGSNAHDHEGKEVVQLICKFPDRPEWNVVETLEDPDASTTRAGLLAVLELMKRATREDPDCETDVVVFTVDQPLFDTVNECARGGWQSAQEGQDLLERIGKEKKGRRVKLLHPEGACVWDTQN